METNIYRRLRKNKGITQAQLAQLLFIDQTTVSKWEVNKATPDYATMNKLADYFGVSTDYLLGRNENLTDEEALSKAGALPIEDYDKQPIPVIGRIVAGCSILAQQDIEGCIYINYPQPEDYFALRVNGDSMVNAGIYDGSIVIAKIQCCADNGQIVVALIDDDASVKRYKINNQGMHILMPENDNYDPIIITPDMNFKILGVVKECRSKF